MGSVAGHAALAAVGLWVASGQRAPVIQPPPRTVELEFSAPPPTPRQPPPEAPRTPPPAQAAPELRPALSARTIRPTTVTPTSTPTVEPGTTTGTTAGTTPTATTEPTATGTQTAPAVESPRVLTTNDLFNPNSTDMMVAARLGGVAIPTGDPNRAERRGAIWGSSRRCTGTPEECARAVAMAPIEAALATQQRPNPPGTGAHARQVMGRALEAFLPVRQIPNVGSIVARGVLVTPTNTREPSAGERALNAERSAATGGLIDMSTGTVAVPQPPYRMVRAEIEVEQDAQGAITGTRVATTSRSDVFDQAAARAIREALQEAEPFRTPSRRRSRWAFEVSEAEPPGRIDRMIRGGGNDGWRVSSEPSNGMHIRYRVRMVSMRVIADEPTPGAVPSEPGRSG